MKNISHTLPASIAIDIRVVPVRELGRTLVVAVDCTPTSETRDRLMYLLNRNVRLVLRDHDWIETQLDAYYRTDHETLEDASDPASDAESHSWYWPSWHSLRGETLVIKASGWEGTTHWTGAYEVSADHPDRAFWEWLIATEYYAKGLLEEREVPKIKRVWKRIHERTQARTSDPKNINRQGAHS